MTARSSARRRSATSVVYEGDTVLFYCPEAKGFLYSDPPCSDFSHVSVQKVESDRIRDPLLPNLQFAAFQLQPVSTTDPWQSSTTSFRRALVFGRKVKIFHIASKKYLSISDESPVAVLQDVDSFWSSGDSTVFRILPGVSGKHRGEDVTQKDTIKLQSTVEKGNYMYLYCAHNVLTAKYELKLGATDSTFTIYAHTASQESLPTKALKAGDPFMLFNVEHEAFASFNGSYACDTLPPELQKEYKKEFSVVARSRRTAQGTQKPLPTSGDTFWQIEKLSDPLSGGQLQYHEKCRVKHLLTQKYLAVVYMHVDGKQQQVVTLQSRSVDREQKDISFTLTPIIKQRTGGLNKGSYVELRHVETGVAIGVSAMAQLVRSLSISGQDSSSSFVYTVVPMETSSSRETAFKLEEVNDIFINEFYHVTSVVSVFSRYIQKFIDGQSPVLDELNDTLEKLAEWLNSTQLNKNRVNMLRATKIIDQLMSFLLLVENTTEDDHLLELCKQVCKVIVKYLENSNYKSLTYLAKDKFLNILLDKIGPNVGAEAVLQVLIQDNTKIGEKIVGMLLTAERSAHDLLKKLDVAILNLFSTLCFTGGKPVRLLQNSILQFVLESAAEQLFRTEVQNDEIVFVFPERLEGKKLSELTSAEESNPSESDFKFFLAQIKLFSYICKGGNEEAKSKIVDQENYITFDMALLCLKDEGIHPKLQSYYLDFVMSAFVHIAVESSGTDIENIWRCYAWPALTPTPEEDLEDAADFTVYNEQIQELKSIIRKRLKGTQYLDPDDVGKNELMLNMLRLMKLLVAYGFYCERDSVRPVIIVLIDIIDAGHVAEDSTENRVIFAVKAEAIRILHLLFKQYTYVAVGRFIYNFKALKVGGSEKLVGDSTDSEGDRTALAKLLNPGFQPDEDSVVTDVCRRLIKSHFDERCYQAMNVFYQDAGETDDNKSNDDKSSNSSDENFRTPLVQILVQLLQFRNDELRMTSARLLFEMHKRENILFSNASDSYISTEPSFPIFVNLVTLGSLSDEDKLFVKMHTGKLGDLRQTLLDKLDEISSGCLLEDDPAEPHTSYQGITYSTRVFNQLLYFILKHHTVIDDPDRDIVEKACEVLINCTHKNPTVQANVYEDSLQLLNAKIAVSSFARLFTEVLTDNASMCRKLSEEELRQIFQLATSSESPDHFELCNALQAAIKVSKTSPVMIRSNQEFVAELFEKHPIPALQLKDPIKESETIQMLAMNAIDLLSVCAEREGKSAIKYAHELYSIEDLLNLITSKDIPLPHRKPYAHLLTEAFINDRMETSCNLLAKESEFWKHIDYCAELLTSILTSNKEEKKIRIALKLLATSHMSVQGWEMMTSDLDIPIAEEVSLGGALLYLFEGIIPLVTAFCLEFEKLSCSGPTSKIFARLLEGEDITKSLWGFAQSIQSIVNKASVFATSTAQVALLTNCLRALSHCIKDVHQRDAIEEDRKRLLTTFQQQELVSDGKRKYNAVFSQEESLNEEFRIFVQNYQRSYEGKFAGNEKHFGAGVILPQGPSFGLLVIQFSDIAEEEMIRFWKSIFGDDNNEQGEEFHLDSADALKTLLDILSRQLELRLTSQARKELDEMLLTCLQLFTALVENHITSIDRDLQHTNPAKFQTNIGTEVKPVQKRLLDMKVHEKVMLHLDHNRDEITVHALAMLSMLLHFGNEQAQKEIGSLTRHHTQMFSRMHKILTTASSALLGERLDVVKFKQLRGLRVQKTFAAVGLTEQQLAAAEEAYLTEDLDETGAISIPMEPLLHLDSEEETDGPGEPKPIEEKDVVVDVHESKPETQVKEDYNSDNEETVEDEQSDFWDDDDDDSDVNIEEESGEVRIDVTKLPEVQNVSVVLDIIAWICDGQNEEMQKVFRQQDLHLNSFNIVGQVAILLLGISSNLNPRTMRIAKGALQALIEVCAGNYLNQEAAFKGEVTDSIMQILSHGDMEPPHDKAIPEETVYLMRLKASAIELLEVLLEETSELSIELAEGISQDVDVSQITSLMYQLWQLQQRWNEKKEYHLQDETKKAIYRAFHVVHKIADYLGVKWTELTSQDEYGNSGEDYRHQMWKDVLEWSHSIEIDYKTVAGKSILTKAYFPFDPKRHLSEANKMIMKAEIKRDSPVNKLTSLLDWITSIRKNVEYNKKIREKWYLKWALGLSDLRHWILVFLTILMNLFIVFLLSPQDEFENGGSGSSDDNSNLSSNSTQGGIIFAFPFMVPKWYSDYVLYIGGSFHLFFSIWMVLEYFIRIWPDIRFHLFETLVYKARRIFVHNKRMQALFKCLCFFCLLCYKEDVLKDLQPVDELHAFEIDFISFGPLYRLIFLACSITALGTSGVFYSGCLLYIFMRNHVLLVVLSAIRRSAAQLFSVFVLIFVIMYIYAVFSFMFLHEFFNTDDGLFCRNLGECVVTVMREGLLDTLGAGIPLTAPNIQPSFTVLGWRLLLDVSFAIIVTILGLNIVVAILVDRFSAIREEKDKILEDQEGQCFICAIDNDTFEKKGKGFWRHVHEDHNMWNYLYFVLYLDTIFENDRNALESYVYKHVLPKKLNIDFFPLYKAKILSHTGETNEDEHEA